MTSRKQQPELGRRVLEIDPTSGFSTAFESVGLEWLASVIAVGAVIGILSVMFTFMLGVTRVWFAMSRDGLLPRWFAKTDAKHHVPVRVTWIVGFASAGIAGFLPISEAAELTTSASCWPSWSSARRSSCCGTRSRSYPAVLAAHGSRSSRWSASGSRSG